MLVGCKKDLRDDAEASGQPIEDHRFVTYEKVG